MTMAQRAASANDNSPSLPDQPVIARLLVRLVQIPFLRTESALWAPRLRSRRVRVSGYGGRDRSISLAGGQSWGGRDRRGAVLRVAPGEGLRGGVPSSKGFWGPTSETRIRGSPGRTGGWGASARR